MNYQKGSLWRKWDMQIHIPGAKHADQYRARGGINIWDKFIEYINDSDVSVFGITDYFSIERYEAFLAKIKDLPLIQNKVFFPCIEFRLDISVNRESEQLQCHLIFDNKCDIKRIKNFLAHLPLKNAKPDGSCSYCVDEDITACGGYDRVSVSKEALDKALKESFGNERPFLVAGLARGMGSNRANANSNVKKELADLFDGFCDLFFGDEEDRTYFVDEARYENKKIRAKMKPVIATSDCHSLEDCIEKIGKKFLLRGDTGEVERFGFSWIKADTTFEGLKQILFEPLDRVGFSYEKPDSKKSYYLIDKVRFSDNSGQDNFPSDIIEINPNLTTIIGGKSTGKSLLLYYTAKTIDREEVFNRFADQPDTLQYNFDESPNFNFEVVWLDGESTYLKSVDNDENNKNQRKILYIPQNYLNKLSEKNVKSRETLNKFVRDVLLQDAAIHEKYEKNITTIKSHSKSIPTSVANLYLLKQEIEEIQESIKQLGEESGIKKYITLLQKEADEIKNKSGLSAKEIRDYEALLDKEKETTTYVSILTEDKKNLTLFRQSLILQLRGLEQLRDEQITIIGNKEVKEEFKEGFSRLSKIKIDLLSTVDKILTSVDTKISSNQKVLDEVKKDLLPFMAKVKLQNELSGKNESIKKEQMKLDRISLEKKSLESKKSFYEKEKKSLIATYTNIFKIYDTTRNEFKKYENKFEGISLNVSVGFNEAQFNWDVIDGCLNKPDIKRCVDGVSWKDEYEYQYDPSNHLKFISAVFEAVIEGRIKTIKNKLPKEAIVKILDDYFDLDFKIAYKNDPLDKMSPGKKGLVLLRLLIDLSNEEWPILLDQPEDDLDNRSVYDDLVSFVKNKKKVRQIIIVTHNPNLVVGADSEEIIAANQDGQENGRENRKFKFEYVAGALENTFELSEKEEKAILFRKGIRQHVCEVLEGGKEAFQKREQKYNFNV